MTISIGLVEAIFSDLSRNFKSIVVLMIMIFLTMLYTVYITYQTRTLIIKKNDLTFQIQRLDTEALDLKVEEATLMNKKHIESIAHSVLKMQKITPSKEVLLRR